MAKQIGIDLGSANTLVYLKDEGVILSTPTVIAIDKNTGKDLCFGAPAKKMLGKTPDTIKVSKPVREGVIADMDDTTLFITRLLEKTELTSFFSRPDAYVCIPCKYTLGFSRHITCYLNGIFCCTIYDKRKINNTGCFT